MQKVSVRVIPRSSKNEVVGYMENGVLKVKIMKPPIDGKANGELINLLAHYFSVLESQIKIIQGEKNQNKVVLIE